MHVAEYFTEARRVFASVCKLLQVFAAFTLFYLTRAHVFIGADTHKTRVTSPAEIELIDEGNDAVHTTLACVAV